MLFSHHIHLKHLTSVFIASSAIKLILVMALFGNPIPSFAQADSDTEAPSYVDNLEATPGNGQVTLTWDAATDDVGVAGYKIYMGTESVDEIGESYDLGSNEVGDVLEHTVTGLDNNTTYYFAVTALDEAGNESYEYSFEVSATPSESSDDGKSPTVVSVEARNCDSVAVTFSEAVLIPNEAPEEAFTIENSDNLLYLEIDGVSHDAGDDAVVLLDTETMEEGSEYILTVGTEIEDAYGNAMVSGTSDTGVFEGTACSEEPMSSDGDHGSGDDTTAPVLDAVEYVSSTEIQLTFNEAVVLPDSEDENAEDATAWFDVFNSANESIDVTAVAYLETEEADGSMTTDETVVVVTTAEQAAGTEYFLTVTGLADAAGNTTIGDFNSAGTYTTPEASDETPGDVVAPEDVTELLAEIADMVVNLSWASSLDSAGDLVDQILYVSTDDGATYESVGTLAGDATSYAYEGGVEGESYTFKVTTVDASGNESGGTVITASLPTTGAGIGLLAAASLLGGHALTRRRKQ